MKRTEVLQEIRKMRFKEAYEGWQERRLTQIEAARLLGMCDRTFRRYVDHYEEKDLQGLIDRRLGAVSHRRAPVDTVVKMVGLYRRRYEGWNVKHSCRWHRDEHRGTRSYTVVKKELQRAGAVRKAPKRGAHRTRRERAVLPGMMAHEDSSRWDLIITMDDATRSPVAMHPAQRGLHLPPQKPDTLRATRPDRSFALYSVGSISLDNP